MHLDIKILNFLGKEYYIYLIIQLVEETKVEEKIINKIRKDKQYLKRLYNIIKKYIDIESEMIDSETLLQLELISKIDEDLTDIIYDILDIKNS